MNRIDPRNGINDEVSVRRGNYSCDNLEDALKQMEGLVEETLKSSSKRRRPLTTSESENGNSERHFNHFHLEPINNSSITSVRTNGEDGITSILDQFVSEQQDFLLPFHHAASKDSLEKYSKRDSKITCDSEDMLTTSKANKQYDVEKSEVQSENSSLKLRLVKIENEVKDKDEKLILLEMRVNELQSLLNDRMIELGQLKSKLARSNPSSPDRSLGSSFRDKTFEREQTLDRLKKKHLDVEKLKSAVETLMISNEEKNVRIDEMREILKKYKKLEEMVAEKQGLQMLEACGLDVRDGVSPSDDFLDSKNENVFSHLTVTSTPVNPHSSTNGFSTPNSSSTLPSPVKNSIRAESFGSIGPKTPLLIKRQAVSSGGFGTLPKDYQYYSDRGILVPLQALDPSTGDYKNSGANCFEECEGRPIDDEPVRAHTVPRKQKLFARGQALGDDNRRSSLMVDQWSTSAPTIGEDIIKDEMAQQYKAMLNQPHNESGKRKLSTGKAIKKLFNRLKRSNSQEFDDKFEDFKRSGLRSTAGPRLGGWGRGIETELNIPFGRWSTDHVATWLHFMGLGCYVGECKKWVKNGDHLLTATSHELEKELGMKNAFHRKKLQLALQVVTSDPHSPMSSLDHTWVAKWLDDIGLPQYKDQFFDARIDGRMINYLTNDDLMNLKVSSVLHHLSFKCGIQVLRNNDFNPSCVRRRPGTDEQGVLRNCPEEVVLWTNHRVMEWLRSIDLSEYAPNLRGSGVHGGLMILEPRFSAEVLAAILSIPLNKTLLRRHLSTHFVALIGNNVQQQKRNVENDPNYVPLTTNQKIKPHKKIGLFRPRTAELKDDFVCPLDGRSSSHKMDIVSKVLPDVQNAESALGDESKVQEVSSSNV